MRISKKYHPQQGEFSANIFAYIFSERVVKRDIYLREISKGFF